jgi:hypothetical protein
MWTIGRTFLAAAIVALTSLLPSWTALALPIKATPGTKYCQCACRSGTDYKDLSWLMRSSCSVGGHACTFYPSGGGPQQSGKLADCSVCTAQASGTEWRCVPASLSRISPSGQLPQLHRK